MTLKGTDTGSGNTPTGPVYYTGELAGTTGIVMVSLNGTGGTAHYIVKDITLRSNDNTN